MLEKSIFAYVIAAVAVSSLLVCNLLISASVAVNVLFIVAFSASKVSILAISVFNSGVLTLSANKVSNSDILVTAELTSEALAEGDVILPTTVAVWFFIVTITLSLSLTATVANMGVTWSEPSIFTYLEPFCSVIVP